MVQWKIILNERKLILEGLIFHFHDGRKGKASLFVRWSWRFFSKRPPWISRRKTNSWTMPGPGWFCDRDPQKMYFIKTLVLFLTISYRFPGCNGQNLLTFWPVLTFTVTVGQGYTQNKQLDQFWTGKCLTPTQLLICSSFSRENCYLLLICSSLSTSQWGDSCMHHLNNPNVNTGHSPTGPWICDDLFNADGKFVNQKKSSPFNGGFLDGGFHLPWDPFFSLKKVT